MNLPSQTQGMGDSPGSHVVPIPFPPPLRLGPSIEFASNLSVIDTCMSVSCDSYRTIGRRLPRGLASIRIRLTGGPTGY